MNRCPITYEVCLASQKYSKKGLSLLSRNLKNLKPFPYNAKEQVQQALHMAAKLSIQGVQPKLSVKLNVSKENFEIVERGGRYILKPPHNSYDEVPQNEDFTMKCAALVGINVPIHGMIYNIDDTLTYFIKRFDRTPNNQKVGVEDFSQLLGFDRDTKYDASMEKIVSTIEKYCTFPLIEKLNLFRLVIFNFLTGNEDMHLKNFMVIRKDKTVRLSPAYDLLNTAIVMNTKEEIALPLRGKKSKLNREDFVDYFGLERLKLLPIVIEQELSNFEKAIPAMLDLLSKSFLSTELQERYRELLLNRWKKIA
jgi:serine/threonine-protein kinase HipA